MPHSGNSFNTLFAQAENESEETKMAKNDRFVKIYSQGAVNVIEIWVDTVTGVNYVFRASGYAGGLTPLLGRDGKPVISALPLE